MVKVFPSCTSELIEEASGRITMYLKEEARAGACNRRAKEILTKIYNVDAKKVMLVSGRDRRQKRFVIYY